MHAGDFSVHVYLIGSDAETSKWLPRARAVYLQMRRLGLRQMFDQPAKDVEIRANLYSITIQAGGISLESGLYKMAPPRFNDMQIDPTWPIKQANGGTKLAVKDFYPRTEKKKTSTYGGWQPNYVVAENYTQADNKGDSLIAKTPGRYTGTMRKVVQLLIGQGKPVPYNYQWHQCHGIYQASTGKPWVIEISAQGVKAWKLPLAAKLDTQTDGTTGILGEIAKELGYIPKYREIDKQAKNAKVLLGAGSLSPFYSKGAAFSGCGWAFHYSGASAQNTCFNAPGGDGGYRRGYRYLISITEQQGEPAAATLSLVEDGIVHGSRVSGFKVPEEALGMCVDFDLYYGKNPQHPNPTGPLYVFYTAAGTEIVVRMSPPVASEFISNWLVWGGSSTISAAQGWGLGSGWTNMLANRWTDPAPVVTSGYANAESRSGAWEVIEIDTNQRNGFFSSAFGEEGGRSIIKNEFMEGTLHSEYWALGSNRAHNLSAVAPYYDREAVYSVRRIKEYGTRSMKDYSRSTFIRGTNVACLNYTISAACGGRSGWKYEASFATDPRIGAYNPLWEQAGFSKELPHLPTGDEAICAGPLPYLGENGAETVVPGVYTEKVVIDTQLITSGGTYTLEKKTWDSVGESMADDRDKFFNFWDGSNLRWMAVYADAFNGSHNWAYAYRAPNLHDELYSTVAHYPAVKGQLVPMLFVGKP